jgi:hypothetical protein
MIGRLMNPMLDQVTVTMSRLAWMELVASIKHGFALHSAHHPSLIKIIEGHLDGTWHTDDDAEDV